MLKFLNKKKNDNKGFSLVELIIVVAIMAILVGLLAPQYLKYVEKSRKSADASNLDEMVRAIQIYAADAEVTLPADTYTITIGKGGTTVEAGTATQKVDNEKVAKDALNENAPVIRRNTISLDTSSRMCTFRNNSIFSSLRHSFSSNAYSPDDMVSGIGSVPFFFLLSNSLYQRCFAIWHSQVETLQLPSYR